MLTSVRSFRHDIPDFFSSARSRVEGRIHV